MIFCIYIFIYLCTANVWIVSVLIVILYISVGCCTLFFWSLDSLNINITCWVGLSLSEQSGTPASLNILGKVEAKIVPPNTDKNRKQSRMTISKLPTVLKNKGEGSLKMLLQWSSFSTCRLADFAQLLLTASDLILAISIRKKKKKKQIPGRSSQQLQTSPVLSWHSLDQKT